MILSVAFAVGDKGAKGLVRVVAQAAYLQPPGLGPAPPLTVDALVTLPNEEHPGIPGIHTVCVRHGWLLEHRWPRAGWFALWCCLAAA